MPSCSVGEVFEFAFVQTSIILTTIVAVVGGLIGQGVGGDGSGRAEMRCSHWLLDWGYDARG